MKILTIDSNGFPPDTNRWPKKLMSEYESADIVLFTFSPFSHFIMKGTNVEVIDVREGIGGKFEFMKGSGNSVVCEMEAKKRFKRRKRLAP